MKMILTAATAAPLNQEHARAVVLDLSDRIDVAIAVRDTLVKLYGLGGEFLAAPFRPVIGEPLPPLADHERTAAAVTLPAQEEATGKLDVQKLSAAPRKLFVETDPLGGLLARFQRVTAETRRDCEAMLKCPATFNAAQFAAASGKEAKPAVQTLCRFAERGILERVGMGLYKLPTT